jgi:hypothetical protein
MITVKIGCDPEGFLFDKKKGAFVSAHDVLPGTKHKPFKLERGAVQVDGVAVEFNIDPAVTEEEFDNNISVVLQQIDEMVFAANKDLEVRWEPVATFSEEVWKLVPEQSKVLGCDPDYNVKGEVNINPTEKLEAASIRTAAGHIHIGFVDKPKDNISHDHFQDCLYIAKGFFESSLPSFVPRTKAEEERMNYYGHNGSFRPKPYGVELRAPSNWYVPSSQNRRTIYTETRNKFRELTGL